MSAIYGVVRGKVVVLPEDVTLPDGSTVEVRVVSPDRTRADEAQAEEQFKRKLVELGLLAQVRTPAPIPPDVDRTPIEVTGKPLSKMLIEERR